MKANSRWDANAVGRAVVAVVAMLTLVGCAAPGAEDASPSVAADGWTEQRLPGKRRTHYRLAREDGRSVVFADSSAAASMLRRQRPIDAGQLARVRFSWRVDSLVAGADLTDREVADSPVRVVFAFGGDHARLPARERMLFEFAAALTGETPPYATLMYVWDNHAPLETVIPGGRSDRIRKIVVERGSAGVGEWRRHERDVIADFRRAFGEDPGPLLAIGLMTDTDNTGSTARAAYGAIELFGAKGEPL